MLWVMAHDFDTRETMYAPYAYGESFRGYEFAAKELLLAGRKSEKKFWDTDLKGAFVIEEGLLTKSDIKRIEQKMLNSVLA